MRFKILGILAALALVSACETASDGSSTTSGGGASGGSVVQAKPVEQFTTPLGGAAGGVAQGSQEDLVVNVGDRVFFGYDQYSLTADARSILDKQAAWLKSNSSVTISVEGHCDERGTREYNLALGERRASAVKDYLMALGVNGARVKAISYGKERPIALGSTEEAWSQNRRGVTMVSAAGS